MRTVGLWLKGLAAACIGGAANAGIVVFVDPDHFNVHEGIHALAKVAVIGAVVSVLTYLKQSPMPGLHVQPNDGPRVGPAVTSSQEIGRSGDGGIRCERTRSGCRG